jgi:hypothetical protein
MDKKFNGTIVETNGIRAISGGGTGSTTVSGALSALGGFPITGGSMSGKLTLMTSTTASSPLNLGTGEISTNTVAGDVFANGNNIFFKGTTGGPYIFAYKNDTNTFLDPQIISTVSPTGDSNPALRITQAGTGNALVIEDSTNPDSSPFIINNVGSVGIGLSSVEGINAKLTVVGNISATQNYFSGSNKSVFTPQTNTIGVSAVSNIVVVSVLPVTPDPSTLYIII